MNATREQFEACVRILHAARGEDNAITLDNLTTLAGLPNRRTTESLMEENLQRFPYPLVASAKGYFIPVRADQINGYLRSLRSRAMKLFLRAKTVSRKATANGWKRDGKWFARPPAQLDLFESFSNRNHAA
jgi:hypothetical protein